MINTFQLIDWYSMTFPHDTRLLNLVPRGATIHMNQIKSPIPVYKVAYEILPLKIKILIGDERLGLHVIYSGKCLAICRENGLTDTDIWQNMLVHKGRLSRIDLALDIYDDSELTVNNIKAAYDNEECKTSLGGNKFIGQGEEFETLYLGNIKSKSRKLRIYNKGTEQNVDFLWTRVEYEKRRQAMVTARSHFTDGNTISSIIKSVVDFPNWQKWQDAFDCEPAKIGREIPDDKSWIEKLNWLCQTSAPALANAVKLELLENPDTPIEDSVVLNTFAAVLSAELRQRLWSTNVN